MPPTPENEAQLILIPERSAVQVADHEVVLTPTQFRLLSVLVGEPNRVFDRAALIEHVMGTVVEARTVDVHVKELRRKLGPAGRRIETVRGKGYRYCGENIEQPEANP